MFINQSKNNMLYICFIKSLHTNILHISKVYMYLQIHRHIYVQIYMDLCAIFLLFLFNIIFTLSFFYFSYYCCCYCYYRCFCCRYYCCCNFINSPKSSAIFLLLLYRQQIQSTYIQYILILLLLYFFITLYITFFAFFVVILRFSSPFSRSVYHFVFSIHFKLGSYFYTIYVYYRQSMYNTFVLIFVI